jgi:hypothetical protein
MTSLTILSDFLELVHKSGLLTTEQLDDPLGASVLTDRRGGGSWWFGSGSKRHENAKRSDNRPQPIWCLLCA